MSNDNRTRRARERAGLSLGQACNLLDCRPDVLSRIETLSALDGLDADFAKKMCDVYGVRLEWLVGEVPLRDDSELKDVKGWDELTRHDQEVIAEFAASMPRKPAKTLDAMRELGMLDESEKKK